MNTLPDEALLRISACLAPIDRLNVQLCCKRFRDMFSKWRDIYSIDIRFEDYGYGDILQQARCSFQIVAVGKNAKTSYRIRLTDRNGNSYRLRTNLEKYSNKALKLMLASPSKRLLSSLFSLPDLDAILVLDSTPQSSSQCKAELSRSLAECIKGPIKNLQLAADICRYMLTGIYIPWRVMDCLCEKLRCSLKRFAIGCTYGKETRRDRYVKALSKLEKLEDLDIPPHIFHLSDSIDIDPNVGRLLNRLPLTSLGFRHYNSAVLFQYIEFRMPHHIRLLRIHHNMNRVPNFAQLGIPQPEEKPVPRKSSWLSSRQNVLGSKHSIMSSSAHSITSGSTELSSDITRRPSSASNGSDASQTTIVTNSNERKTSSSSLISRHLTIFAIEESARKSTVEKAAKLRRHNYSGVEVFYIQETLNSQEVLGRMAAPMQSPHVYSKSAKREIRVIKGDLVRPIPLASLGMESDYEMTDWED
uniref:F-box domain-containing protein n=1 Tax=Ascaris lumbricoides TaxID=6252 RepID=A0A0M3HPE6_ASCLU